MIPVFESCLSSEEKSALEKKGFTCEKITGISSNFYTGKVLWYNIPRGYKLYDTTRERVYVLCYKSIPVAYVEYVISLDKLVILTLENSNNFWD